MRFVILESSAKTAVCVGVTSCFVCYATKQTNAFEKVVLATMLAGLSNLAALIIALQRGEKGSKPLTPLTRILILSTYLITIPFTLYVGRVFSLKQINSLQIFGLASMGYAVYDILKDLIRSQKPLGGVVSTS